MAGSAKLNSRSSHRIPLVLAIVAQLISLALLMRTDTTSYSIGAVVYSLAWAFAVPYLYSLVAGLDESGRLIVLSPAAPVGAVAAAALAGSMLCLIRVRYLA